jgi:hypothetical protein
MQCCCIDHGVGDERLEIGDARIGRPGGGCHLLELAPVIKGEDAEVAFHAPGRRCAVQHGDANVLVRPCRRRRAGDEFIELGARRHRGRAAVARYDDSARGIAAPAAVLSREVLDPAAQVARQESISCAEHVQNVNLEPADDDSLVHACGDRGLEYDAAGAAALHDDGRLRALADGAKCIERARTPAGDANFFLGANDEVAVRQEGLQLARHFGRSLRTIGAAAVAGKTPEHRPVIHVEHDAKPMLLCERNRAPSGPRGRHPSRDACR